MKISLKIPILLCCFTLSTALSPALCTSKTEQIKTLEFNLHFEHLSIRDGLSRNSVNAILQDKKGFLWIGTWDGGSNQLNPSTNVFRHNYPEQKQPTEIKYYTIHDIYIDETQKTWIATLSGGVDVFDIKSKRFSKPVQGTLKDCIVTDIAPVSDDALGFSTQEKGLYQYKRSENASIEDTVTTVNQSLYEKTDKKTFVALCRISVDLENKPITYGNAGLEEPLLKRGNAIISLKSTAARLPLGTMAATGYNSLQKKPKPGDVLFLMTDGMVEAQNASKPFFGHENLQRFVKELNTEHLAALKIRNKLPEKRKTFVGNTPQFNDMIIIVVKVDQNNDKQA